MQSSWVRSNPHATTRDPRHPVNNPRPTYASSTGYNSANSGGVYVSSAGAYDTTSSKKQKKSKKSKLPSATPVITATPTTQQAWGGAVATTASIAPTSSQGVVYAPSGPSGDDFDDIDDDGFVAELLKHINEVRARPGMWARYLKQHYTFPDKDFPLMLHRPGVQPVGTRDGKKAVQQAIKRLNKTKGIKHKNGLRSLLENDGLKRVSTDRLDTALAVHGVYTHPSLVAKALAQQGDMRGEQAGESIAMAPDTSHDVICRWLIDDGLAARPNQSNILNPAFRAVGIAVLPHPQHGRLVVATFAEGFERYESSSSSSSDDSDSSYEGDRSSDGSDSGSSGTESSDNSDVSESESSTAVSDDDSSTGDDDDETTSSEPRRRTKSVREGAGRRRSSHAKSGNAGHPPPRSTTGPPPLPPPQQPLSQTDSRPLRRPYVKKTLCQRLFPCCGKKEDDDVYFPPPRQEQPQAHYPAPTVSQAGQQQQQHSQQQRRDYDSQSDYSDYTESDDNDDDDDDDPGDTESESTGHNDDESSESYARDGRGRNRSRRD